MSSLNNPESKVSVLVLDDEVIIRDTFYDYLELFGFTVRTAENSTEALDILRQFGADVLVVDYNLPDMNGLSFIKEAAAISQDYITFLVTGSNSLEVAVEGMKIGIHDYLVKPINLEELKTLILNAIDERNKFIKGKSIIQEFIQTISVNQSQDQPIIHIVQRNIK
ncbi:MAG: response regulator [Elusimicrobia bacterium]|nr:response regulator [Candidatus Liberimonas magnetica]